MFSFRVLLVCTFCVSLSISIPTAEQHVLSPQPSPSQASFFSRICTNIIDSIWQPPRKANPAPQRSHLPQKSAQSKYDDDVVLRFKIGDEDDAKMFAEAVDTLYLDVWEASQDWVDVRVSKTVLSSFLTLLPERLQNSYTPVITQLSQAVYDTYPSAERRANGRHRMKLDSGMPHDLFFDDYQPLSVLYPYLRQLASMFPDRTKLFTVGNSHEGRDIPAVQIGIHDEQSTPGEPRQTILIIAGAHAREWISTSTAVYLLRSLLHNPDPVHGLVEKLLVHYDFVFVPVLNPDGYEYTWTTDRLWRKNRQDTSLPFCRGIDLDRSFPLGWDGDSQVENPCSESYAGEHALQATEAQRLAEWARNETQSGARAFSSFIDLHSYSQEILYPYSYTCDRLPHNLEDLEEIAIGLAKAFRLASGHFYSVESACEGSMSVRTAGRKSFALVRTNVEDSGGSALDFFYQDLRVKYAFQIKLRDTGTYGFLLPRENIVPTGVEAFSAMMGLGRWLLGNRGIEGYTSLTQDEIWGEEIVIENQIANIEEAHEIDDEDDDSFWERRRRR